MLFYKEAFRILRESRGLTFEEIGKQLGVSKQSVSNWENMNKPDRPRPKRIYELAKILGCSAIDISDLKPEYEIAQLNHEAIPIQETNVIPKPVPVLSFAQAAGYEPALEPLCDYLQETSDRTAVFYDVPENCFALEVSGDSMAPDYPNGSIALIAAGEFPQRGDIVAAKLSNGQVVIKEYHRCNNVITLTSINPDGKKFEWHCKEQPGYVQWMWPVIEINLKPRDRRWAQRKMGV